MLKIKMNWELAWYGRRQRATHAPLWRWHQARSHGGDSEPPRGVPTARASYCHAQLDLRRTGVPGEAVSLTDAAVVATPVTAADGDTTIADVAYLTLSLRGASNLGGFSCHCGIRHSTCPDRAGMDSVTALLTREQEKRSHRAIQKITNEAGNKTIFTPIILSASGATGPSTVAFLKDV